MQTGRFLYVFILGIGLLSSCSDEPENTDGMVPENYTFNRQGQSTVDFNGQTTRLLMAEELISAMKDPDNSAEDLLAMFRNESPEGGDVNPFIQAELNNSSKSIRNKTAASRDYFFANTVESFAIKSQFEDWIRAQAEEVFPAWNTLASPAAPGQIADGTSVRYINALGLEYNQLVAKSLIGALMLDQMLNNYLSPAVLDEADNRSENDASAVEEGKNYTIMEHKWDEAYGYLFGLSPDPARPLNTLGSDDSFLNEYLERVDSDPDFSGIADQVFQAFKTGRWAITTGDYALRDAQVEIIREKLSEVIAVRAVYYLQQAKQILELNPANKGAVFHDLSEAYGFIYSLRFTRNIQNDQAYFSNTEVSAFLQDLMDDGANGLWDVEIQTLDALSNAISNRFDFTVSQAAD